MNSWRPQASYPCGNFSVTSDFALGTTIEYKGSLGLGFPVWTRAGGQEIKHAFTLMRHVRFLFSRSVP